MFALASGSVCQQRVLAEPARAKSHTDLYWDLQACSPEHNAYTAPIYLIKKRG